MSCSLWFITIITITIPLRMVDNLRVRGHPYNLPECSTNVHKKNHLLCVPCMVLYKIHRFLANVNSSSCSLYVIVRPSVVCLSVTLVHPTQAIEIFGDISTPFGTLAICRHPGKILRRSSQGTPPSGELIKRGVAEYSDFGPIDGYISETVQDRRYVTINH